MNKKTTQLLTVTALAGGFSAISATTVVHADVTSTKSAVTKNQAVKNPLNDLQKQQAKTVTDKQNSNDQAAQQKANDLQKQAEQLPAKQAEQVTNYDNDTTQQVADQITAGNQAVADKSAQQATDYQNAQDQSAKDTSTEQTTLNNDPAISAQGQRDQAANKYDATKATADTTLSDTTQQAQQDQTAADQQDQTSSDQQAQQDQTSTVKQADSAQQTEIADANHTYQNVQEVADANQSAANQKASTDKVTADQQALNDKNTATTTAQSTHDNDASVAKDKQNVNDTQKQATSTQKVVDDIVADAPAVATPNTDISDPAKAQIGDHVIHQEENLPSTLLDPKVPEANASDTSYDYYGNGLEKDKSQVVSGQLSDAQQKELGDYSLTLLNSWRASQGLKPVIWTEATQKTAQEVAKARTSAGVGFQHTSRNPQTRQVLIDVAKSNGLNYDSENMGVYNGNPDHVTMLGLKLAILNGMTAMVYQDGDENFGHLTNFKNMESVGFAFQYNQSDDSYSFPYVFILDGFTATDGSAMADKPDQLKATFADTYRANVNSTSAQYKAAADAKQAFTDAKAQLVNDQKKADDVLTSKLAEIASDYAGKLQANKDTLNASVAHNQGIHDNAITNAKPIHEQAIKDANAKHEATVNGANAKYETAIKQASEKFNKTISDAKTKHDSTIATATATHDKIVSDALKTRNQKIEAAKDETPEQRDARHAKTFAEFQEKESQKLAKLKSSQATELENLKSEQAKKLANLQSARTLGREELLANQAKELADFPATSTKKLADFNSQLAAQLQDLKNANIVTYNKAIQEFNKSKDNQSNKNTSNTVIVYDKNKGKFLPYHVTNMVTKTVKNKIIKQKNGLYINQEHQLVDQYGNLLTRSNLPKTAASKQDSNGMIVALLATIGSIFLLGNKKYYSKKHN